MAFSSFSELLHMGGHAAYVWTAYAAFTALLLALHIGTKIRHKKLTQQLNTLKQR